MIAHRFVSVSDSVKSCPDWRDSRGATDGQCVVDPRAVALQLYTSGTKGVTLSHRDILSGRRHAHGERMEWNEWRDEGVTRCRIGHICGVGWAIVGFLNGAHTIVHREFVPSQVLEAIERQRVSKVFLVPTALHMVLLQPCARD
jgi:acyl-coenzyme A synthetase/AMP-(fatty) acid ligase